MFKKILIANRGEIACRIIASCKRLGIETVAVYSTADSQSKHVGMADNAIHIGDAPSQDSYLNLDKIIAACQQSGAQALHPGYGFLSENPSLISALKKAGLKFIGPNNKAIEVMGDKIASKKLASEAGVSTIPGLSLAIKDTKHATAAAAEIGYPVMIKAAAGGGGKGMRVVHSEDQLSSALESAANEAEKSFGDARVLIEKYIQQPRHIEIQVIADAKGNTLHLGERECSIQRRHQKIIEEAPSSFLSENTRSKMCAQAIALAKMVDYESVGTVEFVVDQQQNFYFLEMNTRLQVEHPVTELITGLDLVEWMIRIAAGEPLPWSQQQIQFNGWAVEARVYSEDPSRDFMPSIGRINKYIEPLGTGIRVDSGVDEGSHISRHYDPMIAKLICHAENRASACQQLIRALDQYSIHGVTHNLSFLSRVLQHPRFMAGDIDTDFIATEFPQGFSTKLSSNDELPQLLLVAAALQHQLNRQRLKASHTGSTVLSAASNYVAYYDKQFFPLCISSSDECFDIEFNGTNYQLRCDWRPGQALCQVIFNGQNIDLQVQTQGLTWFISHLSYCQQIQILSPYAASLIQRMPEKKVADMSKFLLSPMPGLLLQIYVKEGETVKAGQELAVIEAMKMENKLLATSDGIVASLLAEPNCNLAVDQAIIEFC